jgi:aminopeptidase-like protein
MKDIIETLYPMNRCLLGEGADNALLFLGKLIDLDIIEIPSGTKFGTWTIPDEWIIRDAWVKLNGEKIVDYKKNPLSVVIGSVPTNGICDLQEFRQHLHTNEERKNSTPYVFKYYDKSWGFCMPFADTREDLKPGEIPADAILVQQDGQRILPKTKNKLPEGEYEVFIDSEYKPGKMKIGVHTIKGESDREILLFAHIDHPYQANDNLSAVACLVDMVKSLKSKHTIKLIFCAETIGSIAYANTQDISKVDFVIAVDICGNKSDILMQKSYEDHKINRVGHLALHAMSESYRKGGFRNTIGSDEYIFNDPKIGIPGIMLSTWPYGEYHTSDDTPDKIDYEQIAKMQKVILKIIDIWDRDFIPERNFSGPLMRSKYGIQSPDKQFCLSWDYLIYAIDGKKSVAELCSDYGLSFDFVYDILTRMEKEGEISRVNPGKRTVKKTSRKK